MRKIRLQGGKTWSWRILCPVVLGLDLTVEANNPQILVHLRNNPKSLLKCVFLASSPETLILLNMQPNDFDGGPPGNTILKYQSRWQRTRERGGREGVWDTHCL